ncbi:MAG: pilus assembly protein PilM [Syntrophaceae bacterium]|nr:pilus assembly protein PilM [Syntrophaceae bacterium]
MARNNDITSTEKLLDVIRDKKDEAPSPSPAPPKVQVPKKNVVAFSPKKSGSRTMNVGIDAGHEFIRLVKTVRTTDGKWKLLDARKLPYPVGVTKGTPELITFLRDELAKFGCSAKDNCGLWMIMSAAEVEVRHIRIPKVAKKQIANAVYWGMRKEYSFDEKENIFDFEVQGEVIDQGIPKLSVMAYTAPKKVVDETRRQFAQAGIPLDGMVITPFAVQNIFRTGWMAAAKETVASLFIGNEFSRIDVYSKGNLVMSRGIKTGVRSMVEALMETYNDERRPDPDAPSGRRVMTFEEARQIVFGLSPESPTKEERERSGLTEQDVFKMLEPALERLARQVERTFEYFMTNVSNDRVEQIFVSSVMNVYRPMLDYVGEQLAIERDIFDPLDPKFADIPSNLNLTPSERIAFMPALGVALSDNAHTPNVIFTYQQKEEAEQIQKINRFIFGGFIAGLAVCALIFGYQFLQMSQKKDAIGKLEAKLAQFSPQVTQSMVSDLLASMKQRRDVLHDYSVRYLGMAIIGELTALTPPDIRLLSVKSGLDYPVAAKTASTPQAQGAAPATPPPPQAGAPAAAGTAAKEMLLEGLIFGDAATFESQLFRYRVALENSPLFKSVTVKKQDLEPFRKGRVLHFIISMQIG